jgi:hypothetical protein
VALIYRICFLWLFLWPLWGLNQSALHADEIAQEYQLKAAFLVNFARFITWPPEAFAHEQDDFVVCVAGKDPFGGALSSIETKQIDNRSIRVLYTDSLADTPSCHLLFVSRSEGKNLDQLTANLERTAMVTVSDIAGFTEYGGMIEFVTLQNRLSFKINHSAMRQRGIQASASMLHLAAAVL